MTCIVGVTTGEQVILAADRLCTGWIDRHTLHAASPKIWHVADIDALVGITGSLRVGQLVQRELTWPKHPDTFTEPLAYMIEVASAIRTLLGEHGARPVSPEDGEERAHSWSHLLIGWKGGLYEVLSDFGVLQAAAPYAAVGSGSYVALGAMYALREVGGPTNAPNATRARTWALAGLRAAVEHSTGVGAPFDLLVPGGKRETIPG